ncbi:hypothetical protein DMUE_1671 [Dictyocoela muelleri]|nr:hypothetical protein DMUE_1671 [Dictyocoela muelleri]
MFIIHFLWTVTKVPANPTKKVKPFSKPAKNTKQAQYQKSLSRQNDKTAYSQAINNNNTRLVKGMDAREADVQIYMMCMSRGFKELDLEQQFLSIIEKSDKIIQN